MPSEVSVESLADRADITRNLHTSAQRSVRSLLLKAVSFPVLLASALVLAAYVRTHSLPLDPDTWWHLKVGEQILGSGHWPRVDQFSFTAAGTRWIAYEWLGEILIAASARVAGLQGLAALLILLTSILAVLLYYYACLRCGNSKAAFVATLALLPVAAVCFTLRPQLVGYILLLLTLIILEHFRKSGSRAIWLLPVVFLIWVNSHGSFAFGLVVLGVYWLSGLKAFSKGGLQAEQWTARQRKQLLLVLLCCVLVLPLTPYGSHPAAYPLEMALYQPVNVSVIEEWHPVGLDSHLGKAVIVLFFTLLLSQMFLRPGWRLSDLVLLLFACYATFVHARFVLILVLLTAPYLAVLLARWVPAYEPLKDKYLLNATIIVIFVLSFIRFFPARQQLQDRVAERFPVGAVAYLRNNPVPGNVLNAYFFGGYLIWSLSAEHKVFIDGRADIYEYSGVLSDYADTLTLRPNTLALLRQYNIRACLLEPHNALRTLLSVMPGWRKTYSDSVSVLYVCEECGSRQPEDRFVVEALGASADLAQAARER